MKKALSSPLLPLFIAGLASLAWIIQLPALFSSGSIAPYYHIDLDVYREGGRALLRGENLYAQSYVLDNGFSLPFTYPPFAAALFAMVSWLPLWPLSVLLTAASLGALWVCLYAVISRSCATERPGWWSSWALCACMLMEPVTETLSFGQVNLLLTAAVVVDCLLLSPRSQWHGVLTGIAIAIKLTPAVFLAVFFVRRDWRALATAVVSFAACGVVGHLASPASSAVYWTDTLRDSSRIGGLAYAGNQSLRGLLSRIVPEQATTLWVLGCIAIVALLWWLMEHTSSQVELVLLASSAALLCSPVSWSHHFTWLCLVAVYLTARRHWFLAALTWLTLLARGHWLVPHNEQLELTWSWWQQIPGNDYFLLVVLLVAACCWVRLTPAEDGALVRRLAPIGGGLSVQPTTGTLPKPHSANDATAQ